MKKVILLLVLLLLVGGGYWFFFKDNSGEGSGTPKETPIKLAKHSAEFNNSIAAVMAAYFNMQMAFVDADTAKAKVSCNQFITSLDSIPLDELKKDSSAIVETAISAINDVKSNAVSLLKQTDITEMRQDFRAVSDMMYPTFFTAINYEGPTLYLQNCPMAFGEEKEANWISNTEEIVNPYLGKNHPEFKGTMLHCGEVKDSIKAK